MYYKRYVSLWAFVMCLLLLATSHTLAGKPAPTPIIAETTDQAFLDNVANQTSSQTVFNLAIDVSGTGTHYRYQIGPSATIDRNDPGAYSRPIPEATPLTADITADPDGDFVLCLQALQIDKKGNLKYVQSTPTIYSWVKSTNSCTPPTFVWLEPSATNTVPISTGDFTLRWDDASSDENALITFFYGDAFASNLIDVVDLAPDGESDTLVWNTTNVDAGVYFLCASVMDGEGTTEFWSSYPVIVGTPPATDWQWMPESLADVGSLNEVTYQIAMDEQGNAMAVGSSLDAEGWQKWQYSYYDGSVWSSATDIAYVSGDGQRLRCAPILKSDGNGNILLVYVETDDGGAYNGINENVMAILYNGSTSNWDTMPQLIDEAFDVSNGVWQIDSYNDGEFNCDAAYSSNGTAMVVWREGATGSICTRLFNGATWEAEVLHDAGILPSIAADDEGHFMIAYAHGDTNGQDEGQLYYIHYDGANWSPERQLNSHGNMIWTFSNVYQVGEGGPVRLAGTGANNFVAVYTSQTENSDIYVTADRPSNVYGRYFDGSDWGPEALLDNQSGGVIADLDFGRPAPVRLAMSSNGSALVVWAQDNGTDLVVYGSRFDGTNWATVPTPLSYNTFGDAKTVYGGLTIDGQGNGIVSFYDTPWSTNYSVVKTQYVSGSGWQLQAVNDSIDRPTDREALTDGTLSVPKSRVAGQADGKAIILFSPYTNTFPITNFSAMEYGD